MRPQVIQATDRLFLDEVAPGRFSGIIQNRQEITDDFLSDNAEIREFNGRRRRKAQDNVLAARIPTAVVDHWIRQGFNILRDKNITPQMILDRLRREDLHAFITTDKTF